MGGSSEVRIGTPLPGRTAPQRVQALSPYHPDSPYQGAIHTLSDSVFVGHCASEEQARRGWEALGSPGEFETYSRTLQALEPDQFMFLNGRNGRIDIIYVNAEQLANIAGRKPLEEGE